jgi:hypothetical protein
MDGRYATASDATSTSRMAAHRKSIASHINSWLKRTGAEFTSTTPRVRMDNLLRDLVEDGEITITELEDRTGHTWQVSTNSYARSSGQLWSPQVCGQRSSRGYFHK